MNNVTCISLRVGDNEVFVPLDKIHHIIKYPTSVALHIQDSVQVDLTVEEFEDHVLPFLDVLKIIPN